MNTRNVILMGGIGCCLLFTAGCAYVRPPADPAAGKIISWCGTLAPQYIKEHLNELDALPYDGVVFDPSTSGIAHWWYLDLGRTWGPDEFSSGIAIMKSLPLQHLRYNFARLNTTIRADWFDDQAWAELVRRFGLFARAARESGAAGIMLDTEQYDQAYPPFWYAKQAHCSERSFAEYNAMARRRGGEVMRAIRQNFPGVNLCFTLAPSMVWYYARTTDVSQSSYGLLVGFFDGILQESGGCTVTDGYELAYPYRSDAEFARAADQIRNVAAKLSADPEVYRRRTKVGFGIWPAGNVKGLDFTDFSRNFDTPVEFEYALNYALRHGDGIVWVYGGGIMPKEYLDAIRNARTPHSTSSPGRPGLEADQTVFAAFYKDHTELLDLPMKWEFRADPDDVGVAESWFAPEQPRAGWKPFLIRDFWDEQLNRKYLGYAWYRVEFNVPSAWLKSPLILAFGAVDELAWVYLNGQPVCDHAQGKPDDLWNQPFGFDVRSSVRPGRNVLVVRVHNSIGPGGIWRGVKLFGPRSIVAPSSAP